MRELQRPSIVPNHAPCEKRLGLHELLRPNSKAKHLDQPIFLGNHVEPDDNRHHFAVPYKYFAMVVEQGSLAKPKSCIHEPGEDHGTDLDLK